VEKDLRASLVAACAAAALSALVGIIAGVGFPILFLRALIGGLLLGAAVFGGISLLRRAVPRHSKADYFFSCRPPRFLPLACGEKANCVETSFPDQP